MYNQITNNKRKTWLLMALFIGVIIALGWAWHYWYGGGYGIIGIAAIFAIVMSLTGYYGGDKIAIAAAGAHPVKKSDNPYLYRLIENLCITAGLPLPKIYIIPDQSINAFATGRDPKHASIAVSEGALKYLENEELEGVLAHELSHIKNFDIRLLTIVIVCIGLITLLADFFLRARLFGIGGSRRDESGGNAGAILVIVGLVLAILAPLFARLIQFAISRQREYLADADGAMLTRYPEGLAAALEKIKTQAKPLARVNRATAHLYISNPWANFGKKISHAFSTHPPIEERIKKLREMA
ncbi:MAG: M48 family metallopeptidase [Candidatus Komeilibacteria bacterium]|nr:M48 family metallopeptidase [Candidatus Komeilibacteria bacterium]